MTHYSCKKGPGYVLILLKYNILSKKGQAMTHYSFKKGPGYVLILLKYNIPSKKGQAMTQSSPKKGPGHVLTLLKYKSPSKKEQANGDYVSLYLLVFLNYFIYFLKEQAQKGTSYLNLSQKSGVAFLTSVAEFG